MRYTVYHLLRMRGERGKRLLVSQKTLQPGHPQAYREQWQKSNPGHLILQREECEDSQYQRQSQHEQVEYHQARLENSRKCMAQFTQTERVLRRHIQQTEREE